MGFHRYLTSTQGKGESVKTLLLPCTLCPSCCLNTAVPVMLRIVLVLQRHIHRPCTGRHSHTCSCLLCHSCHPSEPGLVLVNWSDRPPEPAAAVVRGSAVTVPHRVTRHSRAHVCCGPARGLPAARPWLRPVQPRRGTAPGLGQSRAGPAGTESAARTAVSGLQRLPAVRPGGRPALTARPGPARLQRDRARRRGSLSALLPGSAADHGRAGARPSRRPSSSVCAGRGRAGAAEPARGGRAPRRGRTAIGRPRSRG